MLPLSHNNCCVRRKNLSQNNYHFSFSMSQNNLYAFNTIFNVCNYAFIIQIIFNKVFCFSFFTYSNLNYFMNFTSVMVFLYFISLFT